MSNETFQIIITAAVVLAFLAMIVQGLAALAFYRATRNLVTRLSPLLLRTQAILAVEPASIRRVEIAIDKALLCVDILERVAPRFGTLAVRTEMLALRALQLEGPATQLERNVEAVKTTTHFMSLEMGPRLTSVAAETSALVSSASVQVRRVGRVFHDAIAHFVHLREVVTSK